MRRDRIGDFPLAGARIRHYASAMLRLLVNLLINLGLALAWPFRALVDAIARRRDPFALAIRIRNELPYFKPPRKSTFLMRFLQRDRHREEAEPVSLHELERDLSTLVENPYLKAVVVHLESFTGNGAALTGLLAALEPFRKAGKRLVGYSRMASTREYRLLAQMDELWLGPGGRLELSGYAAEVVSLRDALAKIGVRPQFVRRGEFKTAPEMFTEPRISPAQRQTLDAILDERTTALLSAIETGRKLPPGGAKAALDDGPYSGRRAIAAKLADKVGDPQAIEESLQTAFNEALEVVPFGEFRGAHRRGRPNFRKLRKPPYLAVVPVRGVINMGEGRSGPGPSVAGSDSVVRALEEAAESSRAKAVLLYIDSRGGSAIASELIHAQVQRLAKEKPVLAYFDGVAASGGYMAAVGARELWCAPEAIAGSIGVFAGKFDVEGLLAFAGVGVDELRRGAHAGLYSLMRGWTEDERATMEKEVEETYRDFVRIVANGRKLSEEAVHAVGEGRVFTGTRALEKKLVDGNCSFRAALEKAWTLGGLPMDAPMAWIDPAPSAPSPIDLLRPALDQKLWMLDLTWLR